MAPYRTSFRRRLGRALLSVALATAAGAASALNYLAPAATEAQPGSTATLVFRADEASAPPALRLPDGWQLISAPSEPGAVLLYAVAVPPDAAAGRYTLALEHAGTPTEALVEVAAVPHWQVELLQAPRFATPGAVEMVYAVRNDGNVVQPLVLQPRASRDYPLTVTPQELHLAPQQAQQVTLTLQVPADLTRAGEMGVQLTLQGDDGAEVGASRMANLELIPAQPDETALAHTFPLALHLGYRPGEHLNLLDPCASDLKRSDLYFRAAGGGPLGDGAPGTLSLNLAGDLSPDLDGWARYDHPTGSASFGRLAYGLSPLVQPASGGLGLTGTLRPEVEALPGALEVAAYLHASEALDAFGGVGSQLAYDSGGGLGASLQAAYRPDLDAALVSGRVRLSTARLAAALDGEETAALTDDLIGEIDEPGVDPDPVSPLPLEPVSEPVADDDFIADLTAPAFAATPVPFDLILLGEGGVQVGGGRGAPLAFRLEARAALERLHASAGYTHRAPGYGGDAKSSASLDLALGGSFVIPDLDAPAQLNGRYRELHNSGGLLLQRELGAGFAVSYRNIDASLAWARWSASNNEMKNELRGEVQAPLQFAGAHLRERLRYFQNNASGGRSHSLLSELSVTLPTDYGVFTPQLDVGYSLDASRLSSLGLGVDWHGRVAEGVRASAGLHLSNPNRFTLDPRAAGSVMALDARTVASVNRWQELDVQLSGRFSATAAPVLGLSAGYTVRLDVPIGRRAGLGVVEGEVHDHEGLPQAGLVVSAGGVKGVTGADGSFRLVGVPSGEHHLNLRPDQLGSRLVYGELPRRVTVDAAAPSAVALVLVEPAAVIGEATVVLPIRSALESGGLMASAATDESASGLLVELEPLDAGGRVYRTLTERDGTFALPQVLPGRYRLRVPHVDDGLEVVLAQEEIVLRPGRTESLLVELLPQMRSFKIIDGGEVSND